ncbi:hypothetical protein MTR67_047710 [Solanum verrucosum]|uniref:Uncharacterized protein n=1 Tax=Solanum verrucosum TaxID=315347 RepID=A0AAF0UWZ1_SOLVR|nr:hypothetical protein MTR67_047710 [Solanum verrucosum]
MMHSSEDKNNLTSFSAVDYDVPLSAIEATQQELPKEEPTREQPLLKSSLLKEELTEVFGKLVTFECV